MSWSHPSPAGFLTHIRASQTKSSISRIDCIALLCIKLSPRQLLPRLCKETAGPKFDSKVDKDCAVFSAKWQALLL